jgi:hypothetical protein
MPRCSRIKSFLSLRECQNRYRARFSAVMIFTLVGTHAAVFWRHVDQQAWSSYDAARPKCGEWFGNGLIGAAGRLPTRETVVDRRAKSSDGRETAEQVESCQTCSRAATRDYVICFKQIIGGCCAVPSCGVDTANSPSAHACILASRFCSQTRSGRSTQGS